MKYLFALRFVLLLHLRKLLIKYLNKALSDTFNNCVVDHTEYPTIDGCYGLGIGVLGHLDGQRDVAGNVSVVYIIGMDCKLVSAGCSSLGKFKGSSYLESRTRNM